MAEVRRTTCNRDCPDACSILATVEDGRVTRLAGDPDHPVTRGFLCWRTNHFLPLQYGPDRITQPLLRRAGGEQAPVSWDEALGFVAERLAAIRRESGPAAIFHYRSGGSLGLLTHLADYFFEQYGPVTMKRGDICSGGGDAAQLLDFGDEDSNDLFDLQNARNILLWGKNVFVSSPHSIPVLKQAAARGARLVLVDPVHHRTASLCERTVAVRPGGDFALAMAVARLLFERGWVAPDAASRCDHLDELRALALGRPVGAWCAEADVTAAEAEDLAERLGRGGPTAILVGWGMARRVNGGAIVRALDALSAITGNLWVRGGGSSYYFKRRGAFDLSFIRGKDAAPRTICEPMFGPEVLAATDPPIRAVWVTGGNPVAMLPESDTVAEALRTRDLVVVVDSFATDTTRLAHVVLPTTTLLEADDLLGAYGHHWLGAARPVVAPPPDVRTDLQILQELGRRLGMDGVLDGDARAWKERMVRGKLAPHGLTLAAIEEGYVKNPLPPPEVLFGGGTVATTSGRVNLVHQEPPAAVRDPAFPLLLMALSTDRAQSSQWSEKPEGPAVVTVHPDAAAGIADGALATMESAIASMTVRVRHDARQRRDVALTPKGGHVADGQCANRLVRARTTDLGDGGALYDEGVRLLPL